MGLLGIPEPEINSQPLVENTSESYRKYRPTTWKDVEGQDEAVKMLRSFIDEKRVPHAILLYGPSGTGKTTCARIMRAKMRCNERSDFFDINAAEKRGIDDIRDIMHIVTIRPMCSPCRIWLIDECHKLTDDAQGALLKALENTPEHAYFFLATTNPNKLRKEIRTRCTSVIFNPLSKGALEGTAKRIADIENRQIDQQVLAKLIEVADGSARQIVNDWDRIKSLPSIADQLKALEMSVELEQSAYDIVDLLLDKQAKWSQVAVIIAHFRDKKGEEPEGLRCLILKNATSRILGKSEPYAGGMCQHILNQFQDSYPWSGIPGWANLVRAAYQVFQSHRR